MVFVSRAASPSQCMRHDVVIRQKFDGSSVRRTCVAVSPSSSSWDSAKKRVVGVGVGVGVGGCRRGRSVIVAASPPTEDAVVVTEPLTKKDLVDYLASGCKPKDKWRCHFNVYLRHLVLYFM